MKKTKLERRKSFAKWGMPGQRTMTETSQLLEFRRGLSAIKHRPGAHNIGKNNGGPKSVPGVNRSTQFTLQKHSCLRDPMGRNANVIPSYEYNPAPKYPSRRDRRRMLANA